jgi:signal transduction histidine kinase
MEDGLRRVQKIVRQLLDFSQQHEPALSVTDLNAVVERVLVLTDHAFTANRIRLEKRLSPDLPSVMADRHMIEQVLMNLILNAIQAIKSGGVIRIRTRLVDDRCAIEVGDTGCGIPSHVLPRIFDPFFTTKGIGEGTGLGLSVSLGIVERHGGQLLVDSEVGKGSVFAVCLPLTAEGAPVERVV